MNSATASGRHGMQGKGKVLRGCRPPEEDCDLSLTAVRCRSSYHSEVQPLTITGGGCGHEFCLIVHPSSNRDACQRKGDGSAQQPLLELDCCHDRE